MPAVRAPVTAADAALASVIALPQDQATLYLDLILNALSGNHEALREVEHIMIQNYEPRSRLLRKYLEEGRHEGRQEGREEGRKEGREEGVELGQARAKAEDILSVLDARGLAVSKRIAQRVRRCRDLPTLDQWLRRAATVDRATKLFE
jgi:predicted transposase YdaD